MPTSTFTIATSADDGRVFAQSGAYPPGGSPFPDSTITDNHARRSFLTPNYNVSVALFRWDTSSLPDNAVLASAQFKFYLSSGAGADGLNLVGEWYSWSSLASGDYSETPPVTPAFSVAQSSLVGGVNTINLSTLTGISVVGFTGLRVHVSQLALDAAPTGDNDTVLAAIDDAVHASPAQLLVTWAAPSPPPPSLIMAPRISL